MSDTVRRVLPSIRLPRNAQLWLPGYLRSSRRHPSQRITDVMLCVADHFEPDRGDPGADVAQQRVDDWVQAYPRTIGELRDADGKPPQHTFFYPAETYRPAHLDALAGLIRGGYGDVEVHLHHDNDTPQGLIATLSAFTDALHRRHGLLRREADGRLAFGFIHGNWALDNASPDGRWCGINNELTVLRELGCYADFTMPCAPH